MTEPALPTHVSFVCSGNICRSPYAEARFRRWLEDEGWSDRIEVSSAGTLGIFDRPAHPLSIAVGEDLELSGHRSRGVNLRYLKGCGLVLGLSPYHVEELREDYADFRGRVYLLGSFPDSHLDGEDVPDPIGHGLPEFHDMAVRIDAHVARIGPAVLDYFGMA